MRKRMDVGLQKPEFASKSGSTTVEFVILALPLLFSTAIFFLSLHTAGMGRSQGSALARESVHAFVDAADDLQGYLVVSQILNRFETVRGSMAAATLAPNSIRSSNPKLSFSVRCSMHPCISPEGVVQITIHSQDEDGRRKFVGSAQSTVSKWIG